MKDWAAVIAAVQALPGVEQGTSYGHPALKVRGRPIAGTTGPDGSFVLHLPLADKEVLIDTDPDTFWESDHYRGWPALLVRYGTPATDRIATLLHRAWWDRATVALRKGYGDRP